MGHLSELKGVEKPLDGLSGEVVFDNVNNSLKKRKAASEML